MEAVFLWGGEEESKKATIYISQQSRTSRGLYSIQISLRDLWEIRNTLSRTLRHCCQGGLFSSQMKAKRYWLVLSIRILKNSPHKAITVKHWFPVVKSSRTLLGLLGTEDFLFIPCFLTPASRTFPEFQKGRFQQFPLPIWEGKGGKDKGGAVRKQQCSLRANTIWRVLPLRKWQPTP